MARYFLEVAYKGTRYSGFQIQENALTIQTEIENAFSVLHRMPVSLTGSSRTDAGVHALQNFFHFDFNDPVNSQFIYKMNAILPGDIVVRSIFEMPPGAHSRFDATAREYIYKIHRFKDPFSSETSLFYPFKLDMDAMYQAASIVLSQSNFFAFSKTNTQVKTFECSIVKSNWASKGEELTYTIKGNRFLRGMVRLLTATMLKVGRRKLTLQEFESFFRNPVKCGFSIPATGLFLKEVSYPENYFPQQACISNDF
ncbi:MAG TPA: tRNA pseudouridine(38-40) synthase TruA [Flavisolibacter sp.]|nr:tRNA pseudouridine(38-40) synthase TruA [Flavisolibacter sp.]